jgi:hypothetical protein
MRRAAATWVVVGACGLGLCPGVVGAQPVAPPGLPPPPGALPPPAAPALPAPPPPPSAVQVPGEESLAQELRALAPEPQRAVLDEALRALLSGNARDAMVTLTVIAQRDGVDLQGYSTVAVTLRLATALATGTRPPVRARPWAQPAAPGALPPPPSDTETVCRVIDGTVELIAAQQFPAARAFLEGALAGREALLAPYMPLAAVRLVVQGVQGPQAAPQGPLVLGNMAGPPRGLAGPPGEGFVPMVPTDRPAGTMDGAEALALYVAGGTAGLVTGVYLASLAGERNEAMYATLPFLGLAGGLVGAALVDRGHTVRRGRGYATNAGLMLGLLGSTSLTVAAEWEFSSESSRAGAHAMMLGAALGGTAGYGIAALTDAQPGTGSFVLSCGAMGWFLGLMGGLGTGARDTNAFTASLVGEGVGVALGALLASTVQPTPAQMRWFDLGGMLGAMVGASFGSGLRDGDSLAFASATGAVVGAGLGLFLGAPTAAERMAYQRRLGRGFSVQPRLGAMPLPGGGVITLGL